MNGSRPLQKDITARRGFTLVEVVIALAIFVFGALAIIRIFPPALGVIQNSGDRLVGNNLNRSLLARYDRSPELLPDAIYDPNRAISSWNDPSYLLYGSVAGSRRNKSIPTEPGVQGFEKSALARYRHIIGERHTIPGSGLVYTQFPFVNTTTTNPLPDPASSPTELRAYTEDSLAGVVIDGASKKLDFSKATLSSTDAPFTPVAGDIAFVSYRWLEGGRYWSVDEERLELAAGTTAYDVVQARRPVGAVTLIVPGEVKVRVRRVSALPTISIDDASIGLIRFPTTAAGTKISLDYHVQDWRWLVVDGVPNANPDPNDPVLGQPNVRIVNLPVRLMDVEQDQYLYAAYPTQPAGTATAPAIKTNRDNPYTERVVRQQGIVPFTTDPDVTTAPSARVVYRTADNWTQQLSVAAKYYTLYYDDTLTPQDRQFWRQCFLDATGPFLYFHPSEAGKSVLVSYRYRNGSDPNDDKVVENQLLTIDTDIISPAPTNIPVAFSSQEGGVARLQFVDIDGRPLTQQVTAITKIQGAGIQSRVAWLDGSRFTQVTASRLRGGDVQ